MSRICCCRSSNAGEYAVEEDKPSIPRQTFMCCCCYVRTDDRPQTIWGSVLLAAGAAFCTCYVIHNFSSTVIADLLWFCAGLGGAFIFFLGLLLLICVPVLKWAKSAIAKSRERRYAVTPQPPELGRLVGVQRRYPVPPSTTAHLQVSNICLPPHKVDDDSNSGNQESQGERMVGVAPDQLMFQPQEQLRFEEIYMLSSPVVSSPADSSGPVHGETVTEGDLTNAMRGLSTQVGERKVFLRRSLSLSSGLANWNHVADRLSAVMTGPPVQARIVKSKPLVFFPLTQEPSPKSKAVICTRQTSAATPSAAPISFTKTIKKSAL